MTDADSKVSEMSNLQKVVLSLFVGTSVIWAAYGFIFSDASAKRDDLKEDIASVKADNAALRQTIADKERTLEAIDTRPEAQKQLVREELGYIGKDEIIVELPSNAPEVSAESND